MTETQYDIIVFGATSFVGQILTRYLAETYGVDKTLRWALAGRNPDKLAQVAAATGTSGLDRLQADSDDLESLRKLTAHTRLVISTVGPYALYGEKLVRACAESGTDYVDLTGEVQWIDEMIHKYEGAAKASGARIVHCCGFDSIPSDLGAQFTQEQAQEQLGTCCQTIDMRVKVAKGGVSGGTVASMLNIMQEAAGNAELRRKLNDPYLLCPAGYSDIRTNPVLGPRFDADHSAWLAPFVMEGINSRVVHRSHALLQQPWGRDFQYSEAMLMGSGMGGRLRATMFSAGLGAFIAAAALGPTRAFLRRFVVPKPGEGPSPEAQQAGYYDIRFTGKTSGGQTIQTRVTGDQDPGYGSTAKMLGEAAVCMVQDVGLDERSGGFWTPASAMGAKLRERLQNNAGLAFQVL